MRILLLGLNGIGERVYNYLVTTGEDVLGIITMKEQLKIIKELKPDLVISAGFRHIIPKEVLELDGVLFVNFHKAFLPFNKGAHPNVWSILDDKPAGVSIHEITPNLDSGPVICQEKVPVQFSDTADILYKRLEDAQFEMFVKNWQHIKNRKGRNIAQTDIGTCHTKQEFKDLCEISPEKEYKAIDLINLLRAMTFPPFQNAYIIHNGKKYFIEVKITPER